MQPLQTNTSACFKGSGGAVGSAVCGVSSCAAAVMAVALPLFLVGGAIYGIVIVGLYTPASLPEVISVSVLALIFLVPPSAAFCGLGSKCCAEAAQDCADYAGAHFAQLESA